METCVLRQRNHERGSPYDCAHHLTTCSDEELERCRLCCDATTLYIAIQKAFADGLNPERVEQLAALMMPKIAEIVDQVGSLSADERDESIQDAWVLIMQQIVNGGTFDPNHPIDNPMKPYLRAVLTRIQWKIRNCLKHEILFDPELIEWLTNASPSECPEAAMDQKNQSLIWCKIRSILTSLEYYVIYRFYQDRVSLKDIAAEINKTHAATRAIKSRAIKKLRGRLDSDEF